MPEEPKRPSNQTLTSWKEIAQFFKREVRTVQKWEKEEGLPVHRHLHHRQSSVYAYPEELERWWRERGAQLTEQQPQPVTKRRKAWTLWGVVPLGLTLLGLLIWMSVRRETPPASAPAFRTITLDGTRPGGRIGGGLVGDLNGDGVDDLVLSAGKIREVYVLFGGNLPSAGAELPAAANVVISGTSRGWMEASQVGDFNGDGVQDLLLTQTLEEPESFHATGASYIVWGRRQWPKALSLPEAADVTIRLEWTTDARMGACDPSGRRADLNGDGMADVVLGASEYGFADRRAAGSVFVFFGRKQWPRQLDVVSAANLTIRGSRTGEGLGGPCAVGDFNGDKLGDIAVHASESTLWGLLGAKGRTYVFLGQKAWPRMLDALSDFDSLIEGARSKESVNSVLLADVNGDGKDDLVIGTHGHGDAGTDPGDLRMWFGRENFKGSFSASAADVVVAGNSPGAQLGHAVLASDLDGDGFRDLIVSEPRRGEVHLLYGRKEWKKSGRLDEFGAVRLFAGPVGAGSSYIGGGDLDGDQLPELVVSFPEAGTGQRAQAGRVWVLKPYLPLRVDVRPDAEPNVIMAPGGTCAVRLFGFSPAERDQLEPSSVRFAGMTPTRYTVQDYDGDGVPDLQVYFEAATPDLSPETKQLAVTARTRGGLPVGGADKVVVVPHEAGSPGPKAPRPPARPQ